MAAGRHGGYRENEFRDRETNFHVSRRSFGSARQEFERVKISNGDHGVRRSLARDVKDKFRVSHEDMKENAVVNGHYHSSSTRSNSSNSDGVSRSDCCLIENRVGSIIDREPGELSSGSGSDDAIESGFGVRDREVSKVINNGKLSSMEKKRKFSPIVWDRDDNKLSHPSRNGTVTTVMGLPRPQKLTRQSPNIISDRGEHTSSVRNSDNDNVASSLASGLEMSESLASPVLPKHLHHNVEVELLDNEDNGPARNISFSRWAGGNTSPANEGEILDEKEILREQKIPITEIWETELHRETPGESFSEAGDCESNGFKTKGTRERSTESNEQGTHGRFLRVNENSDSGVEKGGSMEVDERHNISDVSCSPSDTESDDDNDICSPQEPPTTTQRSVNMLQGCRSVDEFERLNKIDEGTYGIVYRARDKKTGEIVALKKVKMEKEREGFPLTALREINILLSFHHPSIVDVKEVVVGNSLDSIFMAMEYMEHDLKGLMETMKHPFTQSEVKCLMIQLLEGVRYLHSNWVLHRDLKTSNLLLNNQGELKICDFGLARQYGSPLKPYTHLVVTLWYRAPELLLGTRQYSTAIDMWSLGCIMAELLSKEPLFNGKTEVEQLDKIFRTLGTPNETIWPGYSKLPGVRVNFVKQQLPALGESVLTSWPPCFRFILILTSSLVPFRFNQLRKKFPATSFTGSPVLSESGFDLLSKLLAYDPQKRISAEEALDHEWFREVPLPKSKEFMPTFPAQHARDRRMRRILRSPDPLEEQRIKELQQQELGTTGLFGER